MDKDIKDVIVDNEGKVTQPEDNEENDDTIIEKDDSTADEAKSFTQEELDAIVEKRLAREAKKNEKIQAKAKRDIKQAEELAKLSAEDRAQKEFELEKEDFERQQQEFYRERLELQTTKELDGRDLPVSFAKYVIGDDAEMTRERINEFETLWEHELERRRVSSMRGTTPTKGIKSPALTQEEFDDMKYSERVKIFEADQELYNKLTQ